VIGETDLGHDANKLLFRSLNRFVLAVDRTATAQLCDLNSFVEFCSGVKNSFPIGFKTFTEIENAPFGWPRIWMSGFWSAAT
jgi:hypothetical protein